ncbi:MULTISPECIES: restriction endonuclease subunit S [Methylobacterium]|uniref:restriction endonuclease subunit S n=1 Tax=Methylobacterium TaxID=407 RepID=UPI00138F5D67|nr:MULTISPECIES: restriction endonuclease subunit S [Methylobacterium]MCI9882173.1 restriction endonuclease subunit S [Methylobacterium goesingense]
MALYYGAVGRYHGSISGIISPAYNVFRHKDDADPRFLEALVRLPRMIARYEALSQGGNLDGKRKLTPYDAFETVKVIVPPLAEQRAIAALLSVAKEEFAKTEAWVAQIYATAEAISEALFLGIDPSSGALKREEWKLSTLGAEMSAIKVGIVVRPASYYVSDGGVPALRSLNVRPNRLLLDSLVQISKTGHQINNKSALRAGDVVTVRTGEPGKTAYIMDDFGGLNCIDIIFSRPGPSVRGEYVSYFMNSGIAKRQIAFLQGGLAQQHLNVGEMKRIKISVPPLAYQDQTIALLNEVWACIDAGEAKLRQLRRLQVALAEELLSGRLRLPERLVARFSDTPAAAA